MHSGVYQSISSVVNSIVFFFSTAEQVLEAYCTDSIDQLKAAVLITSEHSQCAQFDLPPMKTHPNGSVMRITELSRIN